MAIDVERMEVLGVNVNDVDKARELFSRLFGLEFTSLVLGGSKVTAQRVPLENVEIVSDAQSVQGRPIPLAFDSTSLFELVQAGEGESSGSMRNIHFKVADIEAATAEMVRNGIRVVDNLQCGALREVIFHPNDLFGVRLCFVQYSEPSIIQAMLN